MQETYYAVWQESAAIFGVGTSIDAAIDNALEYLDSETKRSEITQLFTGQNPQGDNLYVAECSAALYAEVESEGGDLTYGWDMWDGSLITVDEEDQVEQDAQAQALYEAEAAHEAARNAS